MSKGMFLKVAGHWKPVIAEGHFRVPGHTWSKLLHIYEKLAGKWYKTTELTGVADNLIPNGNFGADINGWAVDDPVNFPGTRAIWNSGNKSMEVSTPINKNCGSVITELHPPAGGWVNGAYLIELDLTTISFPGFNRHKRIEVTLIFPYPVNGGGNYDYVNLIAPETPPKAQKISVTLNLTKVAANTTGVRFSLKIGTLGELTVQFDNIKITKITT